MKTNCVIVTYNRRILLEECVKAVLEQSYPLNSIIIVNNNSTDNTLEFLDTLKIYDNIKIINLNENIGGAGGFNVGLKESFYNNCDWTWMMDDDTIPTKNALENLVNKADVVPNIGFLASKVLWTNNEVHLMNIACPQALLNNVPYNQYSFKNLFLVPSASFVSFFVKSSVVEVVGLPIKEFFIWGDDVEFSKRIVEHGFQGAYVDDSVVFHKTNDNYSTSLISATINMKWKFFYKFRNGIFQVKENNSFFIALGKISFMLVSDFFEICKREKGKIAYVKVFLNGSIKGLFFSPKIEKVVNSSK